MTKARHAALEQYVARGPFTAGDSWSGALSIGDLRLASCDPRPDSVAARRRELLALFSLAICRHVPGEPKSNPGMETRSIDCPSTRSIVRTMAISSGAMKVKASPVCAARPVRPMRWT
jgi:hypothetical protein